MATQQNARNETTMKNYLLVTRLAMVLCVSFILSCAPEIEQPLTKNNLSSNSTFSSSSNEPSNYSSSSFSGNSHSSSSQQIKSSSSSPPKPPPSSSSTGNSGSDYCIDNESGECILMSILLSKEDTCFNWAWGKPEISSSCPSGYCIYDEDGNLCIGEDDF